MFHSPLCVNGVLRFCPMCLCGLFSFQLFVVEGTSVAVCWQHLEVAQQPPWSYSLYTPINHNLNTPGGLNVVMFRGVSMRKKFFWPWTGINRCQNTQHIAACSVWGCKGHRLVRVSMVTSVQRNIKTTTALKDAFNVLEDWNMFLINGITLSFWLSLMQIY